jgi:oxygen-dependent protoporphyrinogen oxidase
MRAAVPQLFEAVRTHRSLMAAVLDVQRRAAAQQQPRGLGIDGGTETAAQQQTGTVFMGIDGGVGRLPLAVADAVRAAGGEITTSVSVRQLQRRHGEEAVAAPPRRDGDKRPQPAWEVVVDDHTGRTRSLSADAVVLAVPAPVAARLLAVESPAAASELATVEYASMALVTLAYRRQDVAVMPEGSGFLVPPVDGRTIKAATFSSQKWAWLTEGEGADPELFVLRTSIGRFGDEEDLQREDVDLVAVSRHDLREAVGLAAEPVATRVTRWDRGLPQYPVGHLGRVARIRDQVAKLPGLRVCGALYDGVGIPACIAGAHAAADELLGGPLR